MAHWPVESLVLLTATSRWFVPTKAPLTGSTSRVRMTWNQRRVTRSNRQLGSAMNGPNAPVVGLIAGG
jgi:hypothetical protein